MRIRLEQLEQHLRQGLHPVYLISGDEPLLVQEACDAIRQAARQAGHDERQVLHVDRQFDWQRLQDEANALSLFAERKLTELRIPNGKPGTHGSKALVAYCERLPDDTILLIEAGKIDAGGMKSKWVNTIDKIGVVMQVWPVTLQEMPKWLERRSRDMALKLSQDAISALTDRLEGNLLAAQQELQKLKLLHADALIEDEHVLASVGDSARYDIFDLTDACLTGKARHACKILHHMQLEGSEPTLILWALSKELRLLQAMKTSGRSGASDEQFFKQQRIIKKRQAGITAANRRLTYANLQALLEVCKRVDDAIKGAHLDSPWSLLEQIALRFCGITPPIYTARQIR